MPYDLFLVLGACLTQRGFPNNSDNYSEQLFGTTKGVNNAV